MKINGIEIKPGMVIYDGNSNVWIVFPIENNFAVINYNKAGSWMTLDYFVKFHNIKKILDISKGVDLCNGTILYEND